MSDSRGNDFRPAAPAMGERNARWGYGYQDKAATDRIIGALKEERRQGGFRLECVRLADVYAGRVDDFVLVWEDRVEGNSIKWRKDPKPVEWGDLIGAGGLLKELADGYLALRDRWGDRTVRVRLQTSYPASETRKGRLVQGQSVAEFVRDHWRKGGGAANSEKVREAWQAIKLHTGLQGGDWTEFVDACNLSLGVPEPRSAPVMDEDTRVYARQFDRLHQALATWITNHPTLESVPREYLLEAVGLRSNRSEFVQTFPHPDIPYRRNIRAALALREMVDAIDGGYVAVSGLAGGGKSTLVQDVLGAETSFVFIPYFAFLPHGEGHPRDRGEALNFYHSVIGKLDRVFSGRSSLGIENTMQGREALRRHMGSAHEGFVRDGTKTVLVVDGVDHVQREGGIRESILSELSLPDEIPAGFLIVLSGRQEAFWAEAVGADISGAVAESGERRLVVGGLSKGEVHEIALEMNDAMSVADRDRLYGDSKGNPLILTYLLKAAEGSQAVSALTAASPFDGDIVGFYRRAFAVPLEDAETKRMLGLLCRAAGVITSSWLKTWPERTAVEDLYRRVLAPFMHDEEGHLRFIHSSLVVFLRTHTRGGLPASDPADDEASFYSELADRTAGRLSSDPLGLAHVSYLVRSGRLAEVPTVVSSRWLRESVRDFVPYKSVRPMLLEALRAAWDLEEYGHVVRLVLIDTELAQRSAQLEAGELADAFLKLEDDGLALAQVRANGTLLADDDVALAFARKLWFYAQAKGSARLRDVARRLYSEAKPVGYLAGHGELQIEVHGHAIPQLLGAWSAAAPLFEPVDDLIEQLCGLKLRSGVAGEEFDWERAKADLLAASLRTAIAADVGTPAERSLIGAIAELNRPESELESLLEVAWAGRTPVSPSSMIEVWRRCGDDGGGLALGLAERLNAVGERDASKPIVEDLAAAAFAPAPEHGLDKRDVDVAFVASLTCLCREMDVRIDGALPVESGREEAFARVEAAARCLGELKFLARCGTVPGQLQNRFREVLFYESRPIGRPAYDPIYHDVVVGSRREVVGELLAVAREFGPVGMRPLRDVVLETARSGPFLGWYRQRFALAFLKAGVIGREVAVELGLSWTEDTLDEDPRLRQEACLETAAFLRRAGSDAYPEWIRRAGGASAGAGSHKDYRMAHLALWLDEAVGAGPATARQMTVTEKFVRALEVSGGDGRSEAAERLMGVVLRTSPGCAAPLAVEMIDRSLVGLASVLEALVVGGADAGADPDLLSAVFEELLSLVALESVGSSAVAIVETVEGAERVLFPALIR